MRYCYYAVRRREDRAGVRERVEGSKEEHGPLVYIKALALDQTPSSPAKIPLAGDASYSPPPTLLDNPTEILHQISLTLGDSASLAALSSTCVKLHNVVAPILYSEVHLRHSNQLSPFFASRPSKRHNPSLLLTHIRSLHLYPYELKSDSIPLSIYLPIHSPLLHDVHLYGHFQESADRRFPWNELRPLLRSLDPTRLFIHTDRLHSRSIIPIDAWIAFSAGWFSLSVIVNDQTCARLSRPNYSGPYCLFFPTSPLNPARQPLQIVFDLGGSSASGLRLFKATPDMCPLLDMISYSTGFRKEPSFGQGSIAVLVGTQAERIEVQKLIAAEVNEDRKEVVRVKGRSEWYASQGIECPDESDLDELPESASDAEGSDSESESGSGSDGTGSESGSESDSG